MTDRSPEARIQVMFAALIRKALADIRFSKTRVRRLGPAHTFAIHFSDAGLFRR